MGSTPGAGWSWSCHRNSLVSCLDRDRSMISLWHTETYPRAISLWVHTNMPSQYRQIPPSHHGQKSSIPIHPKKYIGRLKGNIFSRSTLSSPDYP